ncbi:hypothetical protein [Streptomyces gilvus]|nr:hypothetical protein [Streptomyces sp. CME 23]
MGVNAVTALPLCLAGFGAGVPIASVGRLWPTLYERRRRKRRV